MKNATDQELQKALGDVLRSSIRAERRLTYTFNSIMVLTILAILFWIVSLVHGQDNTALALAQCIRAECDTCRYEAEPAATMHVIRKGMEQWNRNHAEKRTLADQAWAYCAVFDAGSRRYYGQRALNIRNSTFDKPLHGSMRWWKRIRELVRRFQDGDLADPTPEADHFGGTMDMDRALRAGWIIVARFSNTFWMVR